MDVGRYLLKELGSSEPDCAEDARSTHHTAFCLLNREKLTGGFLDEEYSE
jgi:hypothetical protein